MGCIGISYQQRSNLVVTATGCEPYRPYIHSRRKSHQNRWSLWSKMYCFPPVAVEENSQIFSENKYPAAAEIRGQMVFFPKPSGLCPYFWGTPVTTRMPLTTRFRGIPNWTFTFRMNGGGKSTTLTSRITQMSGNCGKQLKGKILVLLILDSNCLTADCLGGILLLPSGPVSPIASRSFQRSGSFLDLLKVILDP